MPNLEPFNEDKFTNNWNVLCQFLLIKIFISKLAKIVNDIKSTPFTREPNTYT